MSRYTANLLTESHGFMLTIIGFVNPSYIKNTVSCEVVPYN